MKGLNNDDDDTFTILGVNKINPFRDPHTNIVKSPISLLRPSQSPQIQEYVLCDLKVTVEWLRRQDRLFVVYQCRELEFDLTDDIYGFSRNLVVEVLRHLPTKTYVFQALLFRLSKAHTRMKECTHYSERFRWQLYIDSHIPICRYIQRHQQFLDSVLTDESENVNNLVTSVVDYYAPGVHKIRHYCGDLPNMIELAFGGNAFGDIRQTKPTLVSALIHVIVCKTQDHKCQVRNFVRILFDYFHSYPVMVDLFKLFIRVSLLGNYPFCGYRPKFSRRIDIINQFDDIDYLDKNNEVFFKWLAEHEQLVCYMTKEFYIYITELEYTLDKVMANTSNWTQIKKATVEAMDVVRNQLCKSKPEEDQFKGIEEELKVVHQSNLIFMSKLKKEPFVDIMVSELGKYHEKHAVNKYSTQSQASEQHLSAPVLDGLRYVAMRMARKEDSSVELCWLKCFGITESGYNDIRDLLFSYEKNDIADNAISRPIAQIYQRSNKDFHLLRVYFKQIQEVRSVKRFRLSRDYMENHVRALRCRYGLMPWEDLPPDADVFYYCKGCKRWANPMVEDNKPATTSVNIHARGCEKALYDPDTKKLYCGKQTPSITLRKLMESGLYQMNRDIADTRTAKMIRKNKEANQCRNIELTPVHMAGHLQKLNDKIYALCEVCASLMPYEGVKFNRLGMCCIMHRKDRDKVSESEKRIKKVDLSMFKDDILQQARFTAKLGSLTNEKRKCVYCEFDEETILREQGKIMRQLRVLDQLQFRDILLCENDYRFVNKLFDKGKIPFLEEVMTSIGKTRTMVIMKFHSKRARSHT